MKKFWLTSVGLVALGMAAPASAADLAARPYTKAPPAPVVAVYDWTGFYIGINGGGAWGRSRQDSSVPSTTGRFNISGGLGGGTVGANWQTGAIVLGIEADLDATDIRGSTACPTAIFTCSTSNTWLARYAAGSDGRRTAS
jgi:outer membrane immunogenic protein